MKNTSFLIGHGFMQQRTLKIRAVFFQYKKYIYYIPHNILLYHRDKSVSFI